MWSDMLVMVFMSDWRHIYFEYVLMLRKRRINLYFHLHQ